MNKKIVLALGFLPFPLFAFPADPADPACPLPTRAPCGVEEVISCALLNYNKTAKTPLANNKAFYDTQLFDAGNQDGFCEYKTESGTYPPGVIAGNLTGTYYDQFCSSQTGSYFSYGNFTWVSHYLL